MSAFPKYRPQAWPYQYACDLHIKTLCGSTPTDPKVAERFLKTRLADRDELVREEVAQLIAERGVSQEDALKLVNDVRTLTGFRRDENGLYIEGRCIKAAIKEAVSVAVAAGKIAGKGWGETNKGAHGFATEHIFVVEDRLHLGVNEPSGVIQGFVHSFRPGIGKIAAIKYEEYVTDVKVSFHVEADVEFEEKFWAMLWLTAEQQGTGGSRSQGYGRFEVTRWDLVSPPAETVTPAQPPAKLSAAKK